MRKIKLHVPPFILIASFLMLLISGEAFGGFFIVYIFMGLFIGATHSILGLMGVALIVAGFSKFLRPFWKTVSNICGSALLLLSLFVFFYNDKTNYNTQTFFRILPVILIILFIVLALLFLIENVISAFRLSTYRKSRT